MARVDQQGGGAFRAFGSSDTFGTSSRGHEREKEKERQREREREPRTVITRVGKSSGSVITSGRSPGGRGRNLSVGTTSRRKGPAPIIWGAGCTMQTTTRDVEQMMCVCLCIRLVSANACRSIPVFFYLCPKQPCKIAYTTLDKYGAPLPRQLL